MGIGGIPLLKPPPNAAERDGESNTAWILGVTGLFCGLSLATVTLRIYTRAAISKMVGWDDYAMIVAGINSLAAMICFGVQGNNGLGKHYEVRTQPMDKNLQFASFMQAVLGLIPGLAILKISIGLSLLRLSRIRWYTYAIYAFLCFVVCAVLFGLFTIIFFCNPVPRYWDFTVAGKCYNFTLFINFGVAQTAMNIFSDVAFATIPVPIIWQLQMKKRTRFYLIGVFSLGYVAVVMGIVRAIYQIGFGTGPDASFLQRVQFWGFLQLNTGIIAACAPTLRPLVGRWLNIASTNGYGSSNMYGDASNRRRTGYIVQNTPVGPGYELDERQGYGREATIKGGPPNDPFDKTASLGGRSGSEEMILPIPEHDKRIVRTTEVIVS